MERHQQNMLRHPIATNSYLRSGECYPSRRTTIYPVENVIHHFSNLLIIHEQKTNEITTVKEVGRCDPNYHKNFSELLLGFSPRIIKALSSYIKHSKECFIRYPNTEKLVENIRLLLVFSTHFSVFGYLMKLSSSCLILQQLGLVIFFLISRKSV